MLLSFSDIKSLILLFLIILFASGRGFVIVMNFIKKLAGAE